MLKGILLAKAHFRKNKGTSIGLLCLVLITAMMFSLSLLILLDAYPTAAREAERLDAGDGFFRLTEDVSAVDNELIEDIISEDTDRCYIYECLNYIANVPFGNGKMSANIQLCDAQTAFNKLFANSEIVTEDPSITSGYVILPYHFYSAGGYDIGDTFSFDIQGQHYDLKVRGFLTTPYFGCNNSGSYEIVVDDATYAGMNSIEGRSECYIAIYDLKEGVKSSAFGIRVGNALLEAAPGCAVSQNSIEVNIDNRTFMSVVFVIAFMILSAMILIIVLMMLVNSISNYIRENMKTLGALKAIGYTSRDIKLSLHILFVGLAVIGAVLGIIIAYVTMPVFANIAVAQMGIPYHVSFIFMPTLIVFLSVIAFMLIVTEISLRRIRTIEPIVALRDGTESHNFRKNRVRLDRTSFGLNFALAMKTTLFNLKQNIITFLVIGAMVFLCIIGVLMYENFNVNPKVDMLTMEYCSGIAAFDYENKDEGREFLEQIPGVGNVRDIIQIDVYYGDDEKLSTYIIDNINQLNNKNVCFSGRLPQYDNEIAVSGKFSRDYGVQAGDILELTYGDSTYGYLVTGLIQTTNNQGRECIMTRVAAERIMDIQYAPAYYYFDTDEGTTESVKAVFDRCNAQFGDRVISTLNFYDTVEGSLTTFKFVAAVMLILMCVISALVILLVLYLLVRSLVFSKRKDFGIFKAIGYTTKDLVLQTALSFMPSIVISTLIFSVGTYYCANSFMNLIMGSFGIIKSTFTVPVIGVILVAVFIIVVSFLFAVWQSSKIRKIEAYNMLVAE